MVAKPNLIPMRNKHGFGVKIAAYSRVYRGTGDKEGNPRSLPKGDMTD